MALKKGRSRWQASPLTLAIDTFPSSLKKAQLVNTREAMCKSVVFNTSGSTLKCCALFFACGLLISPTTSAESELIASAGKGLGTELMQYRSISTAEMAGVSYSYLLASFEIANNLWQWWGQGSYSYMRIKHRNESQQQNILEIKPVLRWYPRNEPLGGFGEAGVGASYLSQKHFGDIELSTKLNFALHFALGYRFSGGHTLSLRYSHFSNARTNTPNPGFDFASLNGHINF
ncbi:acyloxyacyl hydrolase [Microbulbifer sp. OS29]|uniref:Acyloxyacyl hydrolase n=1 Tax=Microbulbifer okhotskensis TaxID=2926617 RepID=A0A9X2EM35_9GAMM|nr:acyloxyacyl hydrolase [Microbulbifer okhotskensis]MCO1334090.1 acyloxyacyl hydrolase [Microbulbifer okhotskensis]